MAINDKAWKVGFHREIGDESNPTWSVVVGGTSNALHIVMADDMGTDWNVSADSHPSLYIHGSGAAVTEYVKIFTDTTDAHLNVVGANLDIDVPTGGSVSIQVNNTDEYEFSAANLNMNSNTMGSIGTATFLGQINAGSQIVNGAGNLVFVTGRTIVGTNLVIDASGTAIRMSNAASWNAIGTGTVTIGVIGPAAVGSVSVKDWLRIRDVAGTATYYIPCFAA